MKKALVIIILMALPLAVFADFQVGATALYNWALTPEQIPGISTDLTPDDFSFGGDVRLSLSLFQATALMLYSPEFETVPASIQVYLDGGIALDFIFIRLGLGLGPNFVFFLDQSVDKVAALGGNVKLNCDLMLGNFAVGVYYLMVIEDFSMEGVSNLMDYVEGNIGLSVLFKLF